MADLYEPKSIIYGLLKDIEGATVYQVRPEAITSFPCITFSISNNNVILDLDKDIGYQNLEVTIDIWSKTSTEGGVLFSTIEGILREEGMKLDFSSDIPDPDGVRHITTRFNFLH